MAWWRWLAWSVLALTAAPAVAAQASKWRLLETQDELTGAQDRRLILRAEGWTARWPGKPVRMPAVMPSRRVRLPQAAITTWLL